MPHCGCCIALSTRLPGGGSLDLPGYAPENIVMLASRVVESAGGGEEGTVEMWMLAIPKIEGSYTGTGDLTAALFLAHLSSSNSGLSEAPGVQTPLPSAMSSVAASVAAVINRTLASSGPGAELRLIQSKGDLESPDTSRFISERIPDATVQAAHAMLSEGTPQAERTTRP